MTRPFRLILAATALAGCTLNPLNPQDPLGPDGPLELPPAGLGKAAPMHVQYDAFLAAYRLAAYDDWLIASGHGSASNTPLDSSSSLRLNNVPKFFGKSKPDSADNARSLQNPKYYPLDSQTYSQTDIDKLTESTEYGTVTGGGPIGTTGTVTLTFRGDDGALPTIPPGTTIAIAGVDPAGYNGANIVVSSSTPGSVPYPVATRNPAAVKSNSRGTISVAAQNLPYLNEPKPGTSLQSIHARGLAQRGVALADQYCWNFFSSKANSQQFLNVSNDTLTSIANLAGIAGGAAGAATGVAAVPSATSILNGSFGSYKTILNEDFLFGSNNIVETYALVIKAEATDTASNLPEPDNSDWNFQRAIQVIKQHELLCHPEMILSLIKSSEAKAKLCSVPAVSAPGNGQPPSLGSKPGGATGSGAKSANRPASSASSIIAAPAGAGC